MQQRPTPMIQRGGGVAELFPALEYERDLLGGNRRPSSRPEFRDPQVDDSLALPIRRHRPHPGEVAIRIGLETAVRPAGHGGAQRHPHFALPATNVQEGGAGGKSLLALGTVHLHRS